MSSDCHFAISLRSYKTERLFNLFFHFSNKTRLRTQWRENKLKLHFAFKTSPLNSEIFETRIWSYLIVFWSYSIQFDVFWSNLIQRDLTWSHLFLFAIKYNHFWNSVPASSKQLPKVILIIQSTFKEIAMIFKTQSVFIKVTSWTTRGTSSGQKI